MVVRKGKQHYMADHMSHITIGEAVGQGIPDDLPDVHLFNLSSEKDLFRADLMPYWADDIVQVIREWSIQETY